MELPELRTPRLVLRLPVAADAINILCFYEENRDHLTPWRPAWPPDFFTRAAQERHVARAHEEFRHDISVRFVLFDASQPAVPLGIVNFSNIVRGAAQYANVGYALSHRAEGKGLMDEALRTAIAYMFESHSLHRIMANYIPHNVRSGALLRRLNFAVEGYARDYLLIDGRWQDHILTSLTNSEWGTARAPQINEQRSATDPGA